MTVPVGISVISSTSEPPLELKATSNSLVHLAYSVTVAPSTLVRGSVIVLTYLTSPFCVVAQPSNLYPARVIMELSNGITDCIALTSVILWLLPVLSLWSNCMVYRFALHFGASLISSVVIGVVKSNGCCASVKTVLLVMLVMRYHPRNVIPSTPAGGFRVKVNPS